MSNTKREQFGRPAILLLILVLNSFLEARGQSGREILEQTGVKGGLIVHIGCGDGRLTAALRDNERYIVHGLDTDAKNVETARRYIRSLDLYGPVSVQRWNGMALAEGRVFVAMKTGKVICFASAGEMGDVTQMEEPAVGPGHAGIYIISDHQDVEDAALRDREFSDWNFGGGIVLEVGIMPGLYEEHHCANLLRFDLSRLPCEKVHATKVRLYKPKCTVQTRPARIGMFQHRSCRHCQ